MSYAKLATLSPEYGLYSSFVGVFIYCVRLFLNPTIFTIKTNFCLAGQFFATSKDVSIGPVAVMSLEVAQLISHVNKSHPNQWSGPLIATTVSFICGFIVLGIGLLRIGWLVEFISAPA